MKKSLLLIAAAAVAVSASASFQKKSDAVKNQVIDSKCAPFEFTVESAQMATPAQREAAKKVAKNATVKAWYNRPAGSFYRSILSTGGSFYSPAIMNPSWRPVTWPNASEGADSYSWSYEKYNSEIKDFATYTSSEADLTDSWIFESAYAPTLTATSGGATSTYQLFANYYDRNTKETTPHEGFAYFCPDPRGTFEGSNLDCYVSPKLWAAGVREQSPGLSQGGGMVYLTGAKDADGGKEGCWFGKNYGGWNAMGLYVEKPAISYALRGLHVYYAAEGITGETPLTADVYAATKNEADSVILGDLLYTAKGTLAADAAEEGFIDMPFFAEEDGLEYEVVADINQPIMIVLHGYENAQASLFTMFVTKDWCDEGYGQHGYMLAVDDQGTPLNKPGFIGLDDFFSVSLGTTAPSIFLDVEWPMMEWNYTFEDGAYNFPVEGGKLVKTPAEGYTFDYISVFSTKSSELWTVLTEDDQDVPEWLTLEIADVVENDEFTNEVQIEATAAPLPEGVSYREAKVKFSVPGASLVYNFSQGTSGINDVTVNKSEVKKVVENGQIYIINGDAKYNVMGAQVK